MRWHGHLAHVECTAGVPACIPLPASLCDANLRSSRRTRHAGRPCHSFPAGLQPGFSMKGFIHTPHTWRPPLSVSLTYHHKSAIILPKERENKTQSEGPECRSKTRFLQHPLGLCLNPTFWRFLGRATMPLVKPGAWAFLENRPFTLSPSFHACYRGNPQVQKARKGPVFHIAYF